MEFVLILAVMVIVIGIMRAVSGEGFTVFPEYATRVAIAPKSTLLTPTPISVTDIQRVTISGVAGNGSLHRWYALFGPNPDPGANTATTIALANSGPTSNKSLVVNLGWVYAWGSWPNNQTGRISGGANGTRMLIQHWVASSGGPGKHRIFLIEDTGQHTINLQIDGVAAGTLTDNLQYVEFDDSSSSGTFDGPFAIATAPDDVKRFVESISQIAEAAGQPFPPI